MPDCCSNSCKSNAFPRKHICPENGKEYGSVDLKTIKHHIKAPWKQKLKDQGYYFCSDPDCKVVYFGQDDSIIQQKELRTQVGIKDKTKEALICYCYGVTQTDYDASAKVRNFIITETKNRQCVCETRNPSGKCCLAENKPS